LGDQHILIDNGKTSKIAEPSDLIAHGIHDEHQLLQAIEQATREALDRPKLKASGEALAELASQAAERAEERLSTLVNNSDLTALANHFAKVTRRRDPDLAGLELDATGILIDYRNYHTTAIMKGDGREANIRDFQHAHLETPAKLTAAVHRALLVAAGNPKGMLTPRNLAKARKVLDAEIADVAALQQALNDPDEHPLLKIVAGYARATEMSMVPISEAKQKLALSDDGTIRVFQGEAESTPTIAGLHAAGISTTAELDSALRRVLAGFDPDRIELR
jgi:hypothetical protein